MINFPKESITLAVAQGFELSREMKSWLHQMNDKFPHPELIRKRNTLVAISQIIVVASNINWKITSWIRKSPTHKGESMDIAPALTAKDGYAHALSSDPILTKRQSLRTFLKDLAPSIANYLNMKRLPYDLEIYIETHHLHLMLCPMAGSSPEVRTAIFDVPGLYEDSHKRRALKPGSKLANGDSVCATPEPYTKVFF